MEKKTSLNNDDLSGHNLATLVRRCREENERYQKRESSASDSCFEIWRRAFQYRDHQAWEAVYDIYLNYVRGWLHKHTVKWPNVSFEEDALINGAFIRAFRFITPEKFTKFSSLPRLMEYLKICCTSEVMEVLRHQEAASRNVSLEFNPGDPGQDEDFSLGSRLPAPLNVEETVSHELDRQPFWQLVERHLPEKPDRVVVYCRFVQQMPPREIARLYPQYFQDEKEVYRYLRNISWRLKQDPKLKQWFKDYLN